MENTRVFDPMKNKFLGLEDIKQKFGVKPEQIIDVQSFSWRY